MTTTLTAEPAPAETAVPAGVVPPSPRLDVARAALVMVSIVSFAMLLQLVLVSRVQQSAAQSRAYQELRAELAAGTAAIGPVDGTPLAPGTPVALLEIPAIGLRQVVAAGTSASVLFRGPGHRRDTPLPGQVGTSVIYGRRATFGGPFARLDALRPDDVIRVTTAQGTFEYRVLGVRAEGDPVPDPPAPGTSRLLLATAAGRPFLPEGVLRVDADLEGTAVGGPRPAPSAIPAEERLMAGDARTLWALVLWLQALVVLSIAAVWAWHRWGRAQAWVVFLPPLLLVGLLAAEEAARLLPNLL